MAPLLSTSPELSRTILPPRVLKPLASRVPLFFTTPSCSCRAACADMTIMPPGALTALPFSTSASICDGVTSTPTSDWRASNCRLIASPLASATVPASASTTPLLRTVGASSAM